MRTWLLRLATHMVLLAAAVSASLAPQAAQAQDEAESAIAALHRRSFGLFYRGNYKEGMDLAEETLPLAERTLGPKHRLTIRSVHNLATIREMQQRSAEAETLYKRALEDGQAVNGARHPDTVLTAIRLGQLYYNQRRYPEAEPLFKRALAAKEEAEGSDDRQTIEVTNSLALLYRTQGRYVEAAPLFERLAAQNAKRGADHPDALGSVHDLASNYVRMRDWPNAAASWRRNVAALTKRSLRGPTNYGPGRKLQETAAELADLQFRGLIKALYRSAQEGRSPLPEAAREAFEAAQWPVLIETKHMLARMAKHGAKADEQLARLVEERARLVDDWTHQDLDRQFHELTKEDEARLATLKARIEEIDKRLAAEFPGYVALADPAPLPLQEAQALLGDDEALAVLLDTDNRFTEEAPGETFLWLITKTDVRWVRSSFGTETLDQEIQALRCGLDVLAAKGEWCAQHTGQTYTDQDEEADKPLAFDHARSHKLYKALFGQAEDLIQGRRLLIVASSGPLARLPFHVLTTAAPDAANPKPAWLIRDHALAVLPVVSSLAGRRSPASPSAAAKPMAGFGNPLLTGDSIHGKFSEHASKRAQLARDSQHCGEPIVQQAVAPSDLRAIKPLEEASGWQRRTTLRALPPLPETAGELCAIARDLKADAAELRLGANATEGEVKRLSASGQLAQYRIMHFATYGGMAEELSRDNEPGVILTPPDDDNDEEDGYLSASEIAALRLDADWVVLSAYNTAAGDGAGTQVLSGLARAFLYARARAVLVPHWPVNSDASAKLITTVIEEMARDPKAGRAGGLRRSMLALIDKGDAREVHPSHWAPFFLVGDGAP